MLLVTRREPRYRRHADAIRGVASIVVAVISATSSAGLAALLLTLPAFVVLAVELFCLRRASSPHWLLPCWVFAALLLVVTPVWVSDDVPLLWRWLALAAAMVVLISVTTALLLQPSWFDPERSASSGCEWLRRLAGPAIASATLVLVVPGPWPRDLMPAVWALAMLPMVTGFRVWSLDHALRQAVSVIREEGQLGRDQILRDIHGALSTELRQLEQQAREFRLTSPALYQMAVNANSGLRETLTLAEESRDTSVTTDTLTAPVLTLTRAEGASASFRIRAGELDPSDREIARYVLNELVGNALRAGASRLAVDVVRDVQHIVVSVQDNGSSLAAETWKRRGSGSAQLEERLAALSGSLTAREPSTEETKTIDARWRART